MTRKSIGGCVFGLGYINDDDELAISGLIHWQAKSQSVVALSTLEAEYIACSHATREILWLKRMTKEVADAMQVQMSEGPVPIGCDNQGALKLIASGVVRQKSKHIDVKYHHVHDEQQRGSVKFQYITSAANPADLLTKPLAAPRHKQLLQLTSLVRHHSQLHQQGTGSVDLWQGRGGVGLWQGRGGADLSQGRKDEDPMERGTQSRRLRNQRGEQQME